MDEVPRLPALFFRQDAVCFALPFVASVFLFVCFPGALPCYFALSLVPVIGGVVFRRDRDRRRAFIGLILGFAAAALFCGGLSLGEKARLRRDGEICDGSGVVLSQTEDGEKALFFPSGSFVPTVLLLEEDGLVPGETFQGKVTLKAQVDREIRALGVSFAAEGDLHATGRDQILFELGGMRRSLLSLWKSGETGAFYRAALLGDRSGFSGKVKKAFQADGAMHLLAVSGLHVSLLTGVIYAVLMALTCDRRLTKWLLLLALPAMAFLTGGAIPVLRAVLMTGLSLVISLSGRRPAPLTGLALSALLLAVFRPFSVGTASYLFSFSASLGIIAVAGPLTRRLDQTEFAACHPVGRRLADAVIGSFCISLSCFVFTLPCQAYFFGTVQPYAALYNVVLIPLFTPCVALGILASPAAFIPALAFLKTPAEWYGKAFLALIRFVSSGAVGTIVPLAGAAPWVALAGLFILVFAFAFRIRSDHFLILSLFLAGITLSVSAFL